MTTDITENLMQSLYEMQKTREGTDCVFEFELEPPEDSKEKEIRLIHAHKLILSGASPVFKTMFSKTWAKDDENIPIKNASYSTFNILIK